MSQPITRENFDKWMIPVYAPAPFIPIRGEGLRLWDQQGKEYINFAGDVAVNALDRAHPELHEMLNEQASKFQHTGNGYTNEPILRLAKKLIDATFANRVFFCNSGVEANEAALKLARKFAHDRHGSRESGIMTFKDALHGRTLFTVGAGGQSAYSQDLAPLLPDICHAAYNDINFVSALIDDAICTVIIEPIQGEGGVVLASNAFLQGLRELCDRYNALLIFDGVQAGVGRTGGLYACMHYGVTPGLLTTAKALGGGFPVGTLLVAEECASVMTVGTHGTIYGGNPLTSAVAGKMLDLINTPEMFNGTKQCRNWFIGRLNSISHHYNLFGGVRGLGLLIGCVLSTDYAGQTKQASQEAVKAGVMVLITGGNVVRFAPALNVSEEEVTIGLDHFATVCEYFVSRGSS